MSAARPGTVLPSAMASNRFMAKIQNRYQNQQESRPFAEAFATSGARAGVSARPCRGLCCLIVIFHAYLFSKEVIIKNTDLPDVLRQKFRFSEN